MLVRSVAGITLTNPVWWENYDKSDAVIAKRYDTIDGGAVVFERAKKESAKLIELSSTSDSGFQTRAVVDALLAAANSSIGQSTVIETLQGDVVSVRFRHEDTAIEAARVVSALGSKYYTIKIRLARI